MDMKKLFSNRIISALLIMCFLIVTTVTPITPISSVKAEDVRDVTNATTLTLNGSWFDSKTTSQQMTQYFKVVLPSTGFLNIEVRPEFDVEVSFVNADFSKTYFNTTYKKNYYVSLDAGEYEAVNSNLEAGTYYYVVKGVSSNGNFKIKANFTPADNNEIEPNQSFDQAIELTGGIVKGFISEDDEVDFYSVKIGKNQTFLLKPLGSFETGIGYLSSYSIYDSNFNKIDSPNMLLRPTSFNWAEGTYYIKVGRDNYSSSYAQGAYGFEYHIIDNIIDKVQYTYFDDIYHTMYVNANLTVKPVILPASATNQKFVWKSSNTKVATVSSAGKVTGVKGGTAVITATSVDNPSLSISYNLTVQYIFLTFDKYNVGLKVGKKYTIKPKLFIGASKKITYTSLNSKIATVSKNGLVTAKKAGTTKIKVQANGLTKYITIKVTKK
jgi:hypothetical protein